MIRLSPSRFISSGSSIVIWSTVAGGSAAPIAPVPHRTQTVITNAVSHVVWSDAFRTAPNITPIVPGLSFEQALMAELLSLADLTAIVGTRIYKTGIPTTKDLGTNGPVLTYHIPHKPYGHTLSGSDGTATAMVQFAALAYTVSAPKLILEAIRQGIDGETGVLWGEFEIMSSFQSADIDDDYSPRAGSDQWMYQSLADYTIKYRVP